ncbi:NHLP leader peptide family RiPP precursor [Flavobacterium hydrophilum]|uniref:TOMM propeptide domain-containing protein n=1 Tax=Flavobacterium hydrophilum TaxID=2211445 RepID=A0A2V4C6R4_9FLAO|nr:NHLP leader peptide family RiPP precursor [Flavobacterium hydrophilum]PXY46687.1 TOMM propeptide domain-containing protein [Flavobacterium hydrophilum]
MEFTQEQKLYAEIVQKAWEDAEFKKELVANPVATIEKFIGKKLNLPEGKTLVVRDQTDESVVYINIPAAKQLEDAELNAEQLESVAGGLQTIAIWPPISVVPKWPPIICFPPGPEPELF